MPEKICNFKKKSHAECRCSLVPLYNLFVDKKTFHSHTKKKKKSGLFSWPVLKALLLFFSCGHRSNRHYLFSLQKCILAWIYKHDTNCSSCSDIVPFRQSGMTFRLRWWESSSDQSCKSLCHSESWTFKDPWGSERR